MGLYENLRNEPVKTLALRKPVTAGPEDTIRQAVERMRAQRLGCVIVVDSDQKPVGMFTESMLTQLLTSNPKVVDEPVSKHMAEHWPWVRATDPIHDVLDGLHLKNVRFLCVVDENDRLIGLTGQKGLMEYVAEHFPGQVMVQRIGGTSVGDKREGA